MSVLTRILCLLCCSVNDWTLGLLYRVHSSSSIWLQAAGMYKVRVSEGPNRPAYGGQGCFELVMQQQQQQHGPVCPSKSKLPAGSCGV